MKGILGYGRYDDDPQCVGCPRAASDMTPCVARDGHLALDDGDRCVGCVVEPLVFLQALKKEARLTPPVRGMGAKHHADQLAKVVRRVTEPAAALAEHPRPGDGE